MKHISDDKLVELALTVPWTSTPYTDLVACIRQSLNVPDRIAANLANRILDKNLISQVYEKKMVYEPTQAGNKNDAYWPAHVARWAKNINGAE